MNNIDLEREQTKLLYRELFWKANEDFNNKINALKSQFFCKKCTSCCHIRYTDLSPVEIYKLAEQEEEVSSLYVDLFVPYGADEGFDYGANNSVSHELNNQLASQYNKDYVELITAKSPSPVYFYHCKHINACNKKNPVSKNPLCKNFPDSVTTILPVECGYREWQKRSIDTINNKIAKDICAKLKDINDYRKNYSCAKTATCCKFACSEFSYEELKQKAQKGDNFATQFTSIFIPYENVDEARKIFPEYIDFVLRNISQNENVYFYHCPHVTEDNLCSRYESRPQICRDFPNNPLSVLPPNCGFCEWKEEVSTAALFIHALIEILEFNLDKIEDAMDTEIK